MDSNAPQHQSQHESVFANNAPAAISWGAAGWLKVNAKFSCSYQGEGRVALWRGTVCIGVLWYGVGARANNNKKFLKKEVF